ncbi:MAG: hypothetical protein IKP28_02670 [Clostridia bacterium]|nr:hypothetical protein [Clostridia bacterium]
MKEKLGVETILILGAIIIVSIVLIATLIGNGKAREAREAKGEQPQSVGLTEMIDRANDPELTRFNFKFSGYSGSQTGRNLRALVAAVEENNATGERQVTLIGGDDLTEDKMYNVNMTKDKDGYIDTITITKQ